MARPKKNDRLRQQMCERFVEAMRMLELSPTELAKALGYSNSTTVSKVQKGEAFVDVERLYLLSQLRATDGRQVDLNWLIGGKSIERSESH